MVQFKWNVEHKHYSSTRLPLTTSSIRLLPNYLSRLSTTLCTPQFSRFIILGCNIRELQLNSQVSIFSFGRRLNTIYLVHQCVLLFRLTSLTAIVHICFIWFPPCNLFYWGKLDRQTFSIRVWLMTASVRLYS